jgi:glycosyltransferase involved in cell wall biosynthesis
VTLQSADVTVAVPTAGRPAALARLLDALPDALQGTAVAEVLVVDNAPHDRSSGVRELVAGRARYVAEPQRGSAFARNRALAETTTPLVAFLDDDVVPAAGWLAALRAPLRSGVVAVGGCVRLDPTVPRPRWFDERGIGGYVTSFDLGRPAGELRPGEYLVTANALFDVAALRSVGGFDPALGPRPGVQLVADDVHVVRQLQAAGGTVLWEPAAMVVHDFPPERRRAGWLIRRAYLQGRSDWLLDREVLAERRAGGARVALSWLASELAARRRDGLTDPATAFHALTDVSRTAGALRQGIRLARARDRRG